MLYVEPGFIISHNILNPGAIFRGIKILYDTGTYVLIYADRLSQHLYNSNIYLNLPSSYFPDPTNSGCFSTSYVFGGSAKNNSLIN